MNFFDIIIGLLLIWALVKGYKEGIVVQLGGIIGVVIGVFFAFKYGSAVSNFFGMHDTMATVVGFIIVLLAVMITIGIVGWMLRGLFKLVGLGIFDQIGGAVLSMLKAGLVISVLLAGLEALNANSHFISQSSIDRSTLYKPVRMISKYAFPYVDFIKQKISEIPHEPNS